MKRSASVSRSRADKPETLSQAQTWERRNNQYLAAGLCHRCASQAAWGHQLGFGRLEHSPCATCRPVVATFPNQASQGWRTLARQEAPGAPSMRVRGSGGSSIPLALTSPTERHGAAA